MHTLHELYTAVWANFWTPSAPTIAAVAMHFVMSQIRHERRHRELKEQLAKKDGGEPR